MFSVPLPALILALGCLLSSGWYNDLFLLTDRDHHPWGLAGELLNKLSE